MLVTEGSRVPGALPDPSASGSPDRLLRVDVRLPVRVDPEAKELGVGQSVSSL